jgi:hypothetical protein
MRPRSQIVPAATLATVALGGSLLVALTTGLLWSGFAFYLAQALVAVLILASLARPVERDTDVLRLRTRGWVSIAFGLASFLMFMVSPMAYDSGPGRTGWVDGEAFWVAGVALLTALVLVAVGIQRTWTRIEGDAGVAQATQKILLAGTFLGATAYLLLQLAIIYDTA